MKTDKDGQRMLIQPTDTYIENSTVLRQSHPKFCAKFYQTN